MKRLFGLAVLVLAALTFTLSSCQNETKDDKPTAYTVTIANDITNGTVTANKTSAVKGDTVKLTATPDNGWQLSSYSVTDENGNDITVTEGIFTMPASNVTVSATFTKTAAMLNQEAADAVIEKINAIGTVAYTAESKTKIDEARSAYDKLTAAQKELVTNYGTLTTAESTYESLTPTYTVTYADGVDGEEITVPTDSAKYKAGDTVTVKFDGIGTRSCYEFAGWSDGTTTYTSNGTKTFTMGTVNVTLTAQWKITRTLAVGKIGVYEKPYFVGDIVFSDGSALPADEISGITEDQKAAAVAVIFYVGTGEATSGSNENILGEKTLGVGIHNTQDETTKKYMWAPNDTTGRDTLFGDEQNIQLKRSDEAPTEGKIYYQYEYNDKTYYITGDFDGSDNWSKICEQDTEGTADAATNYPAFNWVNNYASKEESHVNGTEYADKWYLPSAVELRVMYDNKTDVNVSLEAAGGTKITDAANTAYWSSSQFNPVSILAWYVLFVNGRFSDGYKVSYCPVCAVRAF